MSARSEAQRARRARERAERRSQAARLREEARRTGTNGVAPESTPTRRHARQRDHGERGQTDPTARGEIAPRRPAEAVYAAGSVHGPTYDRQGHRVHTPAPRQVGWLHADGRYIAGEWQIGHPCLRCGGSTDGAWCTRCPWGHTPPRTAR